jgi:hypothetical protein
MSLLRNFSPGGGQPDDDEEPTTAETTAEEPTSVQQPDETAPLGGGQAPGAARYAFAGPAAGTAADAYPAPATVVPSEVVTEPEPAEEAAEEPDPPQEPDSAQEPDPAQERAAEPVFEASDAEMTLPDVEPPAPGATPAPVLEAPAPVTPPVPTFEPTPAPVLESPASAATPVPSFQPAPAPVPSPRATGEDEPAAQVAHVTQPDFAAPLLSGTAELRARWQRVQGDFVDDPQAAVSDADDLVGQTAQALVDAVRQRQQQLRAAWERGTADAPPAAADGRAPTAMAQGAPDTEQLRLMMQRYRALFNELCRPS